jgi:hypothetical protein
MKVPIQRKPVTVNVPFGISGTIGLGDIVSRVTSLFGFVPCGSCKERSAALNERVVFTGAKDTEDH